LLKFNEIASKTEACIFLKRKYRNNDLIEMVKDIREPFENDINEIQNNEIREEARECLKLLREEGKEFGLTIASSL